MKKIILIVVMAFVTFCTYAQIYSSEACFYLEAGKDIESNSGWRVVYFKGTTANECGSISLVSIKNELKNDRNYFENKLKNAVHKQNGFVYHYNSSMSTTKREVYQKVEPSSQYYWGGPIYAGYTQYFAFSKDKSSLITWREQNDKISDKHEYIRIDKSELLPKAINRDFLE